MRSKYKALSSLFQAFQTCRSENWNFATHASNLSLCRVIQVDIVGSMSVLAFFQIYVAVYLGTALIFTAKYVTLFYSVRTSVPGAEDSERVPERGMTMSFFLAIDMKTDYDKGFLCAAIFTWWSFSIYSVSTILKWKRRITFFLYPFYFILFEFVSSLNWKIMSVESA